MQRMDKRILLVEDDRELAGQVKGRLEEIRCDVTWWPEGRRLALASDLPDVELVILDLMLPGRSGLDMLRDLRAVSDVPVLVLSARGETSAKVRAFQLGADDYMTKPFWPEELVERVRARLRRPVLGRSDVVTVRGLSVDRRRREVTVDGQAVELTRVEFDLLSALAERPGEAVTRAWLSQNVLDPDRDGTERTLDVHVSRLRKKLGATTYVETVWGIGYRLADEVPA